MVINVIVWAIEKVSGGRIRPDNKDESDPWTYKLPGGVIPPWLQRAARGKKDFWREDEENAGVEMNESMSSSSSQGNHLPPDHPGEDATRTKTVPVVAGKQ